MWSVQVIGYCLILGLFRRAHRLLHLDCQEILTAVNVGFVVDRVAVVEGGRGQNFVEDFGFSQ
jgi:hypothetical protein